MELRGCCNGWAAKAAFGRGKTHISEENPKWQWQKCLQMSWSSGRCLVKSMSHFQCVNFMAFIHHCNFLRTVWKEGLHSQESAEFYFHSCRFTKNWECEYACRYSAGKIIHTAWISDTFCSFLKEAHLFTSEIFIFFLTRSDTIVFQVRKTGFRTLAYKKIWFKFLLLWP